MKAFLFAILLSATSLCFAQEHGVTIQGPQAAELYGEMAKYNSPRCQGSHCQADLSSASCLSFHLAIQNMDQCTYGIQHADGNQTYQIDGSAADQMLQVLIDATNAARCKTAQGNVACQIIVDQLTCQRTDNNYSCQFQLPN